jgi:hypothetical protein
LVPLLQEREAEMLTSIHVRKILSCNVKKKSVEFTNIPTITFLV